MIPPDDDITHVHSTTALRLYVSQPLRLIIIRGPDTGAEFDLGRTPLTIGSDPHADIPLTDPGVDPFHGRLYPERHWWMYRDLESSGGSFHQDRPVRHTAVFPGEIIRLGHTEFALTAAHAGSSDPPRESHDTGAVFRNGEWVQLPRIIAHELRHYLEFLDSGVEHLRNDPRVGDLFRDDINTLKMAGHRMDELVQALRDGCIRPRPAIVDLTEILWEQIALLEPLLTDRGIGLTAALPDESVMIRGDAGQLSRAVLNMMKNALEASREGDTLTVRMSQRKTAVTIQISDTGCGMDSDTLAAMWTPLFTTKPDGNGLGAFLAHTIIRRHGGSVRAASIPGRGTDIFLEIPTHDGII